MKLKVKYLIIITVFLSFAIHSCKVSEKIPQSPIQLTKNLINNNEVFKNSFTGFVLYDVKNAAEVININGDKLFTPASNTKILTYYTAINVLNDSIPVLKYCIEGDSLIFYGTGNPLPLNNKLGFDTTLTDFLSQRNERLFYCSSNFNDDIYGEGWAWDDYLFQYHLEKSALPLYGNKITAFFSSDSIYFYPEMIREKVIFTNDSFYFARSFDKNDFHLGTFISGEELILPFKTDNEFVVSLLSQEIKRPIEMIKTRAKPGECKILRQPTGDSIYIRLMHNSDNFIAEQLMLMCSGIMYDTMEVKRSINYAINDLMPFLKDSCRWVDGSGLSRYNLLKPNSLIRVLHLILEKQGIDRIKIIFPEINTAPDKDPIKNRLYYAGVYAKSGSLSNNYNLSGYIITNKSNLYTFSFMNNHFLKNNRSIKSEVFKVLNQIIENY